MFVELRFRGYAQGVFRVGARAYRYGPGGTLMFSKMGVPVRHQGYFRVLKVVRGYGTRGTFVF